MCKFRNKALIELEEGSGLPGHVETCIGATNLEELGVSLSDVTNVYHILQTDGVGKPTIRPVLDRQKTGKLKETDELVDLTNLMKTPIAPVPQQGDHVRYYNRGGREETKRAVLVLQDPDFGPIVIVPGYEQDRYEALYHSDLAMPMRGAG